MSPAKGFDTPMQLHQHNTQHTSNHPQHCSSVLATSDEEWGARSEQLMKVSRHADHKQAYITSFTPRLPTSQGGYSYAYFGFQQYIEQTCSAMYL